MDSSSCQRGIAGRLSQAERIGSAAQPAENQRGAWAAGGAGWPRSALQRTLPVFTKNVKLLERARTRCIAPAPRFFGFCNPNPSPGSPNYGSEPWMTVGPEVAGGAGVEIKEFAGGLYAVTRCEDLQTITDTWHRLATWCEGSLYVMGQHQWLEECFTPGVERIEDYVFDLYLPIAE